MSLAAREHRAEWERYREAQAYYASIRRPALERITFAVALVASIASAGRILGWWLVGYGQWVVLFSIVSFIAFVGPDSIWAKARHPVPLPLGGFNPEPYLREVFRAGAGLADPARPHASTDRPFGGRLPLCGKMKAGPPDPARQRLPLLSFGGVYFT